MDPNKPNEPNEPTTVPGGTPDPSGAPVVDKPESTPEVTPPVEPVGEQKPSTEQPGVVTPPAEEKPGGGTPPQPAA